MAAAKATKVELSFKANSTKGEVVKDWSELLNQNWSSLAFLPQGVIMVLVMGNCRNRSSSMCQKSQEDFVPEAAF